MKIKWHFPAIIVYIIFLASLLYIADRVDSRKVKHYRYEAFDTLFGTENRPFCTGIEQYTQPTKEGRNYAWAVGFKPGAAQQIMKKFQGYGGHNQEELARYFSSVFKDSISAVGAHHYISDTDIGLYRANLFYENSRDTVYIIAYPM